MDRTTLLRSLIDLKGKGLEIGASYNPLISKSEGFDVKIADHLPADGLRAKYLTATNVDSSRIEDVDYVIGGRSLAEAVGEDARFDYIVASHVIEHTPDMLGFLKDCERLLRPNGVLLLAVPDKRHCFDVFQPISSTGDVIQAHVEKRTRPGIGAVFDDRAYNAVRDGAIGWAPDATGELRFFLPSSQAVQAFRAEREASHYIDVHVWKFVPSSFRLIINDLHLFGVLRLREKHFFDSVGNEFYVTLSSEAAGSADDRLTLAKRALAEQVTLGTDEVSVAKGAFASVKPAIDHGFPEAETASHGIASQESRAAVPEQVRVEIRRDGDLRTIDPVEFDRFPFQAGDSLTVLPGPDPITRPVTWGDTNVEITRGHAIRVPAQWGLYNYRGFKIPVHLISLTGAGPETLDSIGRAHIDQYQRHIGLDPAMTMIDLGCGIGRDAFQLLDFLSAEGRYIGIDVTRDSVVWCQRNITDQYPNFSFHHFDAFSELYNPHGTQSSADTRLPAEDGTVDRIVLASVFTHLLEDEVLHYLTEFRRVLKPDGLVYANFFLHSPEAIKSAITKGNTAWQATFEHHYGGGVYGNDPTYPRGAVAYSGDAMRRLIDAAGLKLKRPFLKGWWSGLHAEPDDGQDAAILGR